MGRPRRPNSEVDRRLKLIDEAKAKLKAENEEAWRRSSSRALVGIYNDAGDWLRVSRIHPKARIWEHDVLQVVKREVIGALLRERFGERWYVQGRAVVPVSEKKVDDGR